MDVDNTGREAAQFTMAERFAARDNLNFWDMLKSISELVVPLFKASLILLLLLLVCNFFVFLTGDGIMNTVASIAAIIPGVYLSMGMMKMAFMIVGEEKPELREAMEASGACFGRALGATVIYFIILIAICTPLAVVIIASERAWHSSGFLIIALVLGLVTIMAFAVAFVRLTPLFAVILIEEAGATESIKRSLSMTKGVFWPLFFSLIIIMVVCMMPQIVADVVLVHGLGVPFGAFIGESIMTVMLYPGLSALAAVIYLAIRDREGQQSTLRETAVEPQKVNED